MNSIMQVNCICDQSNMVLGDLNLKPYSFSFLMVYKKWVILPRRMNSYVWLWALYYVLYYFCFFNGEYYKIKVYKILNVALNLKLKFKHPLSILKRTISF